MKSRNTWRVPSAAICPCPSRPATNPLAPTARRKSLKTLLTKDGMIGADEEKRGAEWPTTFNKGVIKYGSGLGLVLTHPEEMTRK
jgi:hypothetical protein